MKIDSQYTTKARVYLISIMLILFALGFVYQVFFKTASIEVPFRIATNFDDSVTVIKPNIYKTQVTDILSNFIIEKPTAYENFVCDTEVTSAFNCLIIIVLLIPWLMAEIKLYNKGVFNIDISKVIMAAGYVAVLVIILIFVHNHFIREFIFNNSKYGIYHPKQDNFFLPQVVGLIIGFFGFFSKAYKRAYDLKQQQDLTI